MSLGSGLRAASCTLALLGWSASASANAASLREVLDHADAHAPAIVVARARIDEGSGARRAAERLLSAPFSVSVAAGPRVGGDAVDADLLLSLTQPLEVAGERGARIEAAQRLTERLEAELDAVRWEVHRDVHYGFHRAIEARLRSEAAGRRRALAEHLVDIARRRRDAGDIADLDVRMAEAELASARQEQLRADGDLIDARLALAELAGWPAETPPDPAGGLEEPDIAIDDATLVSYALRGHPALVALDARVEESEAAVRLSDVEAAPNLDVGVSFAREGAPAGPPNYIAMLTLGAPLPVWNPNSQARERARADRSVARAERDALRAAIGTRVLRAAATLRASRARIDIFVRDVLPNLEANLTLLERGFDVGELGALEVAAATRRVLDVQSDALDAFAEYHRALADLEAEVGREVVDDDAHERGGTP